MPDLAAPRAPPRRCWSDSWCRKLPDWARARSGCRRRRRDRRGGGTSRSRWRRHGAAPSRPECAGLRGRAEDQIGDSQPLGQRDGALQRAMRRARAASPSNSAAPETPNSSDCIDTSSSPCASSLVPQPRHRRRRRLERIRLVAERDAGRDLEAPNAELLQQGERACILLRRPGDVRDGEPVHASRPRANWSSSAITWSRP